jgi:hypothetical protein
MNKSIFSPTRGLEEQDQELRFRKWVNFNFNLIRVLCSLGIGVAVLFLIITLMS